MLSFPSSSLSPTLTETDIYSHIFIRYLLLIRREIFNSVRNTNFGECFFVFVSDGAAVGSRWNRVNSPVNSSSNTSQTQVVESAKESSIWIR